MLFLGVLSVFQLVLFPGLLIISFFPAKRSFIQQLAYIFMLSLLANYVVVFLLTAIGLYLRSVVLVLFIAEVALLLWVNRLRLTSPMGDLFIQIKQGLAEGLDSLAAWSKNDFLSATLYIVFGTIALLSITWVLSVWVKNFNTVFQTWDAWASWDRWAEIWAQNRLPTDTWEYPQLIPISYSITYKFIGTIAVKFFGKSIMPLFTLFIALMLFDLGKKKRSYGYMLGSGLSIYSINFLLGKYISDGYVDIPVACFSLMAVYTLLRADGSSTGRELKQTLLLGSLATAAAAVTKQTGLYLVFFYPVLAYLWVLRGSKIFTKRQAFSLLVKNFLLVLLLVVPWYGFMEYQIFTGGNTSNIQYVINDIYKGQTYTQRFLAAIQLIGSFVYFFVFLIPSLFVLNNKFRQIVAFLIFPFATLWALFLSYEPRNLAIAIPLVAMSTGVAFESWLSLLKVSFKARLRLPAYALFLLVLAALGLGTLDLGDQKLVEKQIYEQRRIFLTELNLKMYRYFSRIHGPQPVITNYPLDWLPGFNGIWRYERFLDYGTYKQNLLHYSDANLILVPTVGIDPRITSDIQDRINAGTYQLIFTESEYMLVLILVR
jgi:hypothetical protein